MVSVQPFRDCLESRKKLCGQEWAGRSETIASLLLSAMLWTPALMGAPARSQQLPPPPTVSVPDLTPNPAMPPLNSGPTVPAALPEVSPNVVYQAPLVDRPIPSDRYIVYINGNSPLLLQAVRTTVPSAFLAQYQGRQVIQTGTFSNIANAQRQISTLTAQGIQADMLTANTRFPAPSPVSPSPQAQAANPQDLSPPAPGSFNALNPQPRYLVVIPASPGDFNTLTAAALRLGIRQDAIQPRQAPLGPHLEIGPFAQRTEAEEVNRYLRQQGMDARVFFNR